jgi:outer membrane receptor protein involved in Fe transport
MAQSRRTNSQTFSGISYKTTLSAAIAAAVGATPALAQEESGGIEEIKVTASKRGEMSLQDFAGSIQAFGAEQIRNQNLFSMEDYSKFTPSMAYFGNQPGSGRVFFRGISDAPDAFIVSSSAAVYIDDQPITQSKQADPRLVDIERVEALSGPQGTLYGSSSQSGTLRIVTNKPDPTKFDAFVDTTLKSMEEGDASYDISGMVNLPLIEDRFAVRLVGFTASEGGFIDNVLGTTPAAENGKVSVNGMQFNDAVVEEDWNSYTISGGRAAAKWFMNDAWSATLMANFQSTDSDAENTYDPTVGDLQIIAFSPDTRTDDWQQYALTLEGDLGFANFTSATSYFTRDSFYSQDTTSYTAYFGTFCYYGTAAYNIYCFQPAGVYYTYNDPIGFLTNDQKNTSFTQEFRLSGSSERFNWVAGLFYEERKEDWDFYTYTTNDGGYRASQGFDNWVNVWGVPALPTDAWWYSGDRTDWKSSAVFGEGTFDVTEKFSITAGLRWFEVEMNKSYTVELPAGRRTPALADLNGDGVDKHACLISDAPCADVTDNPADIGVTTPNSKSDDTAVKFSMQYSFNEDANVYALYSEGFRPGGANRNRGAPKLPAEYRPDFLTNIEFGARTTWADGRFQANLTYFMQDWEDYQLEVVDPSNVPCSIDPTPPCGQPWQKGIFNAGDATSDGIELHLEAAPSDGLSIRANATWLDAKVKSEDPLIPDIRAGARLPFAPEFKGSLYAQYNWPTSFLGSQESFFQFQFTHVGSSLNQVQEATGGNAPQIRMEAYQTTGVKFGVVGDSWEANLFINNAGDERGQLYHDVTDFEPFWGRQRTSVIRPREIGIRFFKSWQ